MLTVAYRDNGNTIADFQASNHVRIICEVYSSNPRNMRVEFSTGNIFRHFLIAVVEEKISYEDIQFDFLNMAGVSVKVPVTSLGIPVMPKERLVTPWEYDKAVEVTLLQWHQILSNSTKEQK